MADGGRYDSAMFWLAFGTAAAVIGLALMTIGVTRAPSGGNLFGSVWFDGGVALLAIGVGLLLLALWLFLGRRREAAPQANAPRESGKAPSGDWMSEAVRGYYRDRENMLRQWQKDQREKEKKKSGR